MGLGNGISRNIARLLSSKGPSEQNVSAQPIDKVLDEVPISSSDLPQGRFKNDHSGISQNNTESINNQDSVNQANSLIDREEIIHFNDSSIDQDELNTSKNNRDRTVLEYEDDAPSSKKNTNTENQKTIKPNTKRTLAPTVFRLGNKSTLDKTVIGRGNKSEPDQTVIGYIDYSSRSSNTLASQRNTSHQSVNSTQSEFSGHELPRWAIPPNGALAANENSKSSVVPNFPNLVRGSAFPDGNCLFHSITHLAGNFMKAEMGVEPHPLAVRKHIALTMMGEFQTMNIKKQQSNTGAKIHHAHYEILNAAKAENNPEIDLESPNVKTFLGEDKQLIEKYSSLSDTQKSHVMNVASNSSYDHEAGDLLPQLMADAFPGLKLVIHTPDASIKNIQEYRTFYKPKSDNQKEPNQIAHLFHNDAHYEPISIRQSGN